MYPYFSFRWLHGLKKICDEGWIFDYEGFQKIVARMNPHPPPYFEGGVMSIPD